MKYLIRYQQGSYGNAWYIKLLERPALCLHDTKDYGYNTHHKRSDIFHIIKTILEDYA